MSDPYQHYIDGEWVSGTGSETFESENPATGETLGTFERGTPEDVESAVDAADAAFEEWRELPDPARGVPLGRVPRAARAH